MKSFYQKYLTLKVNNSASSGGQEKPAYFKYYPSPPLGTRLSISNILFICSEKRFIPNLHAVYDPFISERNYPESVISINNFLMFIRIKMP
jgi:hypothetical protein